MLLAFVNGCCCCGPGPGVQRGLVREISLKKNFGSTTTKQQYVVPLFALPVEVFQKKNARSSPVLSSSSSSFTQIPSSNPLQSLVQARLLLRVGKFTGIDQISLKIIMHREVSLSSVVFLQVVLAPVID